MVDGSGKALKAIIICASSEIGAALSNAWKQKGWEVFGTTRANCDLLSVESISSACSQLKMPWDVLVFAAGALEPIGPFEKVAYDEWEKSIQINFLSQMRILHTLLPHRNKNPTVLFFAGGGTNNAVQNYSGYTISKIALTKMCEFLDAEMPDVKFAIVGPGWVKTKIHEATLRAGPMAGDNFEKTRDRKEWIPMERVVECCTWLATTSSKGVRGRNFSVAHDAYGTPELETALENDPDMYKLRRHKNSWRSTQ